NAKTRRSGPCTQPPKRLGGCLNHTAFSALITSLATDPALSCSVRDRLTTSLRPPEGGGRGLTASQVPRTTTPSIKPGSLRSSFPCARSPAHTRPSHPPQHRRDARSSTVASWRRKRPDGRPRHVSRWRPANPEWGSVYVTAL